MSTRTSSDTPVSPPRRRTRSNSVSPPILSFTPAPIQGDSKRMQNITRDVMRSFEGINVEVVEISEDGEEEENVRGVVEHRLNGAANGSAGGGDKSSKEALELKKIDWEIPRKLLHSSIGFLTLYLYVSNGDVKRVVFVLWSALCVIVPADILRFNSSRFERTYEKALGFLMRESEKHSVNGVIWYILGVNFALAFYPNDIATVAILILSWADTAASTVGRLYSATSPKLPARVPFLRLPLAPRKSLAGFLAATATGALVALGFWGYIAPVREGVSWSLANGIFGSGALAGWAGLAVVSVVAGVVSGVAEALDLGEADDNLTLPIISGGCILAFFKALQWVWS
ncbi:hypothetical protein BDQ17DRAFT_1256805 [Cyathus striatus]|nr:hypothetical protein BDQ17DRAFT_1256805 [Cyathus striatus]